jgi:tetratricopeptide (TPR) repeat protein
MNYHNVGAALFRQKNYDKGVTYFKMAVKRNDKEALSYSWMGDCYKKMEEVDKARECYNTAYLISGSDVYKKQRDNLDSTENRKKGFFAKFI